MKQKANFLLVLTLLTEWCKCWGIVDDVASATKVCLALFWSDWPIACHVINMPSSGLSIILRPYWIQGGLTPRPASFNGLGVVDS